MRSVEAATRDDAIAAAREQFGPAARVVGVRRVRSGGVLGFFATERYVAEVAPDPYGVPGLPVAVPARPAGALTEDPDTGSLAAFGSPLASAAPARARTAPPRNGAAAWAAEAARPVAAAARNDVRATATAGATATAARRTEVPAPRSRPADDERVDELAGLLGMAGTPAEPRRSTPAPAPRAGAPEVTPRPGVSLASFPRATRETSPPPLADEAAADDEAGDAPSPFTAALARMVAGDRDVQHAVREALETADGTRSAAERAVPDPEPEASPAVEVEPTKPAVWSRTTRQKEETVGDQVIAPPSTSVDERTGSASWADELAFADEAFTTESFAHEALTDEAFSTEAFSTEAFAEESFVRDAVVREPLVREAVVREPSADSLLTGSDAGEASSGRTPVEEPPAASSTPVSREEAIAEVLRAALAEGHSDDALAGILRRVVAGDAPQTAPVEPAAVLATEPAPAAPETGPAVDVAPEPVAEVAAVTDLFGPVPTPAAPAPAPAPAPATAPATPAAVPSLSTGLWGEVIAAPAVVAPADEPDAPIRAEVAHARPTPAAETPSTPAEEPLAGTSLFGAPAPATTAPEQVAETDVAAPAETGTDLDGAGSTEAAVAETAVPETAVAETAVAETTVAETTVAAAELEVAPVLARTASDPAPVGRSMTMDETTVMPPLSLLPGSPSRGRGLPPVPPRTGRPPVPPSQSRVPATPPTASSGAASPATRGADDVPASSRTPELLATVTRLPVGPLMAAPETPDMPELADLADLIEADGSGLLDAPELPAAVSARPSRVRIAPPSTPAEVVSRLSALGVPADLLGPAFTADVAADGIYAALTRVLGQRLPEAPELPSGAGDVLFVVGPGVETLRAARSLAATMRLDPDRVQWATRGDLVGLSPETSRMSTIDAALRRRQDAAASGSVTIVAVDAPLRSDAYWMAQMLAIWTPVAVWAVVEATRKPEDIEHWLEGLARVDALIVQDTDLSADPAVVLADLAAPVAVVDGLRATPHRWASVLCERLESAPA
ncbi:hypothetical protein [Blastococcus aurantiacus]|uniref:hypothetical protein n=1 Tax=Blastococcus aurantiacus TaxID=1550231 RepID=UPI00115FCAF5|nr:hypothetical protein [Blastococcus aurantiacus]